MSNDGRETRAACFYFIYYMFYLISSIVSCISVSLILKLAENHQVHTINFILTDYPAAGILVSRLALCEKAYPII